MIVVWLSLGVLALLLGSVLVVQGRKAGRRNGLVVAGWVIISLAIALILVSAVLGFAAGRAL